MPTIEPIEGHPGLKGFRHDRSVAVKVDGRLQFDKRGQVRFFATEVAAIAAMMPKRPQSGEGEQK